MGLIEKFERKFGRFAIRNLTLILIGCYVIGYILKYFSPNVIGYLTLDPYSIIHGQVWRLISWILIPPPEDNIFLAIILIVLSLSVLVGIIMLLAKTSEYLSAEKKMKYLKEDKNNKRHMK